VGKNLNQLVQFKKICSILCRKEKRKIYRKQNILPIIKCKSCGLEKEHQAKGLCNNCYLKQDYQKNKNKRLKQQKEYRERYPNKIRKQKKEYQRKNKGIIKKYQKKNYQKNRNKILKGVKEYRKNNPNYMKEYRKNNHEKIKVTDKKYRKNNHEKVRYWDRKHSSKRRVIINGFTNNKGITETTQKKVWNETKGHCIHCGKLTNPSLYNSHRYKTNYDHIITVSNLNPKIHLFNPNGIINLVLSCRECNCYKRKAKSIEEWYKELNKPIPYLILDKLEKQKEQTKF